MLKIVPRSRQIESGAAPFDGVSAPMSRLLRGRGFTTNEQVQAFLNPSMDQRHDPMLLHDMDKAVRLLREARKNGKRFIVYGDYDVDGICSTAIMVQTLQSFGLKSPDYPACYRIPDRHEEGYGLNEEAVRSLIGKTDILVTVDCGITSAREVAIAKAAGMQVIITDHHALPDQLPEADAVIDPLFSPYPFKGLCGAGVAYQLCRALLGEAAAAQCLDLAALATVADMVPLLDENRAIVYYGLRAIEQTERLGLKALIRAAGLKMPLRSEQIAFGIAPRMNACGRLQSALTAVELLFEEKEERAESLAFELNRLNERRKEEERAVIADAEEQLKQMDLYQLRTIVILGEGYDSGVVGLAAGRIAEKYGYPTVVLSRQNELAVGSARSANGIDIYQALKTCQDLFIRFGGHPQAAGMTLSAGRVPEFRERLSQAVKAQIGDRILQPTVVYDAELALSEVNEATVRLLDQMEPFGMANPAPVFYQRDVRLFSARPVGQNNAHLKCELEQDGVHRQGIAFRLGEWAQNEQQLIDIVYTPVRNEFRGNTTYECQISHITQRVQTIQEDAEAEAAAVIADMKHSDGIRRSVPDGQAALPETVPEQGCLVFCRCYETARLCQQMFPHLSIRTAPYDDPFAYSAIAVGISLEGIRAPYVEVVLADGDLTGMDAVIVKEHFPNASAVVMSRSEALRRMLNNLEQEKATLNRVYLGIKHTGSGNLTRIAEAAQVPVAAAMGAAAVMQELDMLEFDASNRTCRLKPLTGKKDPEQSPLYRKLQVRREETECHTPLMKR